MMEKEFFLTCTVSSWQRYNTGHSDVFCDSSDSVIHGMQDSLSSNFLRR